MFTLNLLIVKLIDKVLTECLLYPSLERVETKQRKSRSSRARCAATRAPACTMASSRARAARASSAGRSPPWSTTSARDRRTASSTASTATDANTVAYRNASPSACPETVTLHFSLLFCFYFNSVHTVQALRKSLVFRPRARGHSAQRKFFMTAVPLRENRSPGGCGLNASHLNNKPIDGRMMQDAPLLTERA